MLTNEAIALQKRIISFPEAEKLLECINCGTCTASCGSKDFMTIGPRGIMRGIIIGDVESVLSSDDPWKCIECFMCEIKCPRDVKPVYIFRALREIMFVDGNRPDQEKRVFKAKKLQKTFVKQIAKNGRISEFQTALAFKGIFGSMKELDIGLDLLKTGRIKIKNVLKYGISFGKAAEQRMPDPKARAQVKRLMKKFYSVNIN